LGVKWNPPILFLSLTSRIIASTRPVFCCIWPWVMADCLGLVNVTVSNLNGIEKNRIECNPNNNIVNKRNE
jgi:hypothetical protein